MTKTLKTTVSIMIFSILLYSCSKPQNTLDAKKAELKKLKTQVSDMQKKISVLEKEIAAAGGNGTSKSSVAVNIKEIQPEEFKRYLDVQGLVESGKSVILSPKTSGQVVKINVSNGASVGKGQIILELDDDILQKSLVELETAYEFANTLFEKQKRLWEQKAGSEVQYLQAKNSKESLEKRMATLKQQISWCKLTAPFAGIVDNIVPKIGEMSGAGMPVVKLTSMSDVKITAEISESYIASVKAGDPVLVSFSELNLTLDAKISSITKSIDARNRTFKADIRLPRIPSELRPNLVCGVTINDITLKNSFVAPLSIIQRSGDKEFLFLAVNENGKYVAKKQFIKTGISYKDKVQVSEGLNQGDRIITNGAFDVADGQPLEIK